MGAIMTAGNSEGTYGRCDAKCHTASKPECSCICGGRYHGVGSTEEAQRRFTEDLLGPEWEDWRAVFQDNAKGPVLFTLAQLPLNIQQGG